MPFLPFLILPHLTCTGHYAPRDAVMILLFLLIYVGFVLGPYLVTQKLIVYSFVLSTTVCHFGHVCGTAEGSRGGSLHNKTAVKRKAGFLGSSFLTWLALQSSLFSFPLQTLLSPRNTVLHTSCSPVAIYTSRSSTKQTFNLYGRCCTGIFGCEPRPPSIISVNERQ